MDDPYRQLEEEIRLRNSMESMTPKMEALMSGGRLTPGALASAKPQPELAYNWKAFHLFLKHQTLRACQLLLGESPRAIAPMYLLPCTCFNIHTWVANPLMPQNVLQDPMLSRLSPTVIVYIVNIVSRQVRQQEKENDAILTDTKPYPT